ncbi:MAG: putative DNA modification/repair radical SAM protein [Candidatus Lokiarchaeota archaeon]|nr:putative DNA modification/repair radical SAM protein [Candidatus Harpocratesius repetitus]
MPTILEKIRVLGENGKWDVCASTAGNRSEIAPKLFSTTKSSNSTFGSTISSGICHSYTPDGRCVSLFKVLFTNKCIYNCQYCFNNVCKQRMEFTPEEYAKVFIKLYTMNVLEGLFLSSGVCGDADETTKKMLKTVKLLRYKYGFQGYIHFKCLPGTSYYLLKEAVRLVDRISINVEAPTKEHLNAIANQKNFNNDIIQRQKWIKSIRYRHNKEVMKEIHDLQEDQRIKLPPAIYNPTEKSTAHNFFTQSSDTKSKKGWIDELGFERKATGYNKIRWDNAPVLNTGQTTQFVLGASEESDWDVLKRLDWEYREINLRRGYFSAFYPISGTPLERLNPTPLDREHRLYQTDWLLRLYDFRIRDIKEILTDENNLPLGDPKIHLALQYFGKKTRVDPNTAPKDELLKVPGIGLQSANRIMQMRAHHQKIRTRAQLKAMGVVLKRAEPFLKINGQTQRRVTDYLPILSA